MSRIPLIHHTNIQLYTQYTHPTLICRGTDTRMHAQTNRCTENIYSIFRDKLLLLGEHVFVTHTHSEEVANEVMAEDLQHVHVHPCPMVLKITLRTPLECSARWSKNPPS